MILMNYRREFVSILDVPPIIFIIMSSLDQNQTIQLLIQIAIYVLSCAIQLYDLRKNITYPASSQINRTLQASLVIKIIVIWVSQTPLQLIFYVSNLLQFSILFENLFTIQIVYFVLILLSISNIVVQQIQSASPTSFTISIQIIQVILCLFISVMTRKKDEERIFLKCDSSIQIRHPITDRASPFQLQAIYNCSQWMKYEKYIVFDDSLLVKTMNIDLSDFTCQMLTGQSQIEFLMNCAIKLQEMSFFSTKDQIPDKLIQLLEVLRDSQNTDTNIQCQIGQDGFDYNFNLNISTYHDSDQFCIMVWFKEINKQQRTVDLQIIDEIMKSISHEFGTNLNCITALTNAYLVSDSTPWWIKEEILIPISQNCEILNLILANIRDYGQLQLNTFKLKLEKFELHSEIKSIIDLYQSAYKLKQLSVTLDCSIGNIQQQQLAEVYTDKQRLRQIILQLLSNSIRFTYQGQITLQVYFRDKFIKLEIQDSGIGMSMSEQHNLLKLFKESQFIKVSVHSVGASLGLHISNLIVKQMNNDMTSSIIFTSEENEGSKFCFQIINQESSITLIRIMSELKNIIVLPDINSYFERPIVSELSPSYLYAIKQNQQSMLDNEIQMAPPSMMVTVSHQMAKLPAFEIKFKQSIKSKAEKDCCPRILVVDDEYFNLLAMTKLLNRFSQKIDLAFNGREALQQVNRKLQKPCVTCNNLYYSIIFLDINMPIMNGIETVRQLKSLMVRGDIQQAHCIANSAFSDMKTKQEAYDAGMDYYLIKPINYVELQDIMINLFI